MPENKLLTEEARAALTEAMTAIGEERKAAAEGRVETTKALRYYRGAFRVLLAVLLIALVGIGILIYDRVTTKNEFTKFEGLVACSSNSTRGLAIDVHTLAGSHGNAPARAYVIPSVCVAPK